MRAFVAAVLGGAFVVGVAAACAAPDANARVDAAGPDKAQFASVHPVLMRRCGSLECHGSPYRNLRLYGYEGARLPGQYTEIVDGGATTRTASPTDVAPDFPKVSTDTELAASYDAVVGLEPEITREVVAAKGAGSNRLTFVRKGRGDEAHKGIQRYCPGDSADVCIQSWLAGAVDANACERAKAVGPGNCARP